MFKRQLAKAIDNWMTSLVIIGCFVGGSALVGGAIWGEQGAMVCGGIALMLVAMNSKRREEFTDD